MNFWQTFGSDLFATIIGVVLGIPAGLLLNSWIERKTQKSRIEKILFGLYIELRENLNTLQIWESAEFSTKKLPSLFVSLYTVSWDAFSNGGELEWIKSPGLLDTAATSYHKIYSIKYLANKYFDMSISDSPYVGQQATDEMNKKLESLIDNFIKTTPFTLELIKDIGEKNKMEIP